MQKDGEPVTVTLRGRPVAVLSPIAPIERGSMIGCMEGSVRWLDDDATSPAADPMDWDANH